MGFQSASFAHYDLPTCLSQDKTVIDQFGIASDEDAHPIGRRRLSQESERHRNLHPGKQ
jgi:hypothetical protein